MLTERVDASSALLQEEAIEIIESDGLRPDTEYHIIDFPNPRVALLRQIATEFQKRDCPLYIDLLKNIQYELNEIQKVNSDRPGFDYQLNQK